MRRLLFHGTGTWDAIRASGGIDPAHPHRVFCEAKGNLASCGGVYLAEDPSYAGEISDQAARRYPSGTLGERTVLAIEVDERRLQADEDVASHLVMDRIEALCSELPAMTAKGFDAFWETYHAGVRERLLGEVVPLLGRGHDPDGRVAAEGVAALIDRAFGPWRPLDDTMRSINALTHAYREMSTPAWFDRMPKTFPSHRRNRRIVDGRVWNEDGTSIVGAVSILMRHGRDGDQMLAIETYDDFPADRVQEVLDGVVHATTVWDASIDFSAVRRTAETMGLRLPPEETLGYPMP